MRVSHKVSPMATIGHENTAILKGRADGASEKCSIWVNKKTTAAARKTYHMSALRLIPLKKSAAMTG